MLDSVRPVNLRIYKFGTLITPFDRFWANDCFTEVSAIRWEYRREVCMCQFYNLPPHLESPENLTVRQRVDSGFYAQHLLAHGYNAELAFA